MKPGPAQAWVASQVRVQWAQERPLAPLATRLLVRVRVRVLAHGRGLPQQAQEAQGELDAPGQAAVAVALPVEPAQVLAQAPE